ncbi:MAG: glycoside hydrolase family 99-like domain-containing protein [Burkholderiales bacterium]|nr:glycoside hydrolase family 99-like domain-containing protein [Burkholderiales bacterium]
MIASTVRALRLLLVLPCFVMGLAYGAETSTAPDVTPGYSIGVFYFPGWKDDEPGAPAKKPWQRLKAYPSREPLLGWYREGEMSVMEQQIGWMKNYGIDYVVFDWYWSESKKPYLEHALKTFLKSKKRDGMQFSILWSNHMNVPETEDQFTAMVDYWIAQYFGDSSYLRIQGKPVVFVFSQQNLRDNAKRFGRTTRELFDMAQRKAKEAGYPGIYFVGSAEAVEYWVKDYGPRQGYEAFSAYNYHRGFSGKYLPLRPLAHSYLELDEAYRESWDWILTNSPVPYVVPMTSGWDKRPWGGSKDPWHDNCESTPDQFEAHLRAAKERLDRFPDKTQRLGVICCWNEFGEGSYIEPTKRWRFEYLERVRSVFGGP